MLKVMLTIAGLVLAAGAAQAQGIDPVPPLETNLEQRLPDLSPLAAEALAAGVPAPRAARQQSSGWNSIKRGFYAGLIAGGIVGALMVLECGHPECGPLFSLAAGTGALIGLTIDAFVDRRPTVPGDGASRRARFVPGKRVAVAIRTSW